MKKRISLFLMAVVIAASASSQVVFSKFKLSKDEPFGRFPGRKMLNTKFKVTADRDLKYLLVDYYLVNGVGDVISGRNSGIKIEGMEYIKPKQMELTGPITAGKSYSPWQSGVVVSHDKGITAFPYQLQVMYMGTNEWIIIPITKENIGRYFPKLQWMTVNRYNKIL